MAERRRGAPALVLLLACAVVAARADELDARVRRLAEELRCVVCQNQTIVDSQVPLANDLRQVLRERLAAGASEAEAKDFLVQRYGDFVLYRPPLKASTALLWAGPALLLLLGAALLGRRLRTAAASDARDAGDTDDAHALGAEHAA